MIEVSESASAVMRQFRLADAADGVHLSLVDSKVDKLIHYSFDAAEPEDTKE